MLANTPQVDMEIVYGKASMTMRPYPSRISGASAEVSRNRNAAWPFGVATDGIFVPVLIATVSSSKCSRLICPACKAALTSLM